MLLASAQMLAKLYMEIDWQHFNGLSGRVAPARCDPSLKLYPVAGFLRAHGLLQNQLLLQVWK
jgi:hypothetical protein